MCPFLEEDDDPVEVPKIDRVASNSSYGSLRSYFFRNDQKFLFIGGGASILAFCLVAYILYSNSKPVNLEELPVISADGAPFKMKPESNEQVKHQDKTVYDNISGNKRKVEEKVIQQQEEILSIPEIESGESLSDEEKKNIIRAFDELAPEKEYQINYIKKDSSHAGGGARTPAAPASHPTSSKAHSDLKIVENELPPINRIESITPERRRATVSPSSTASSISSKKQKHLRDILPKPASNSSNNSNSGGGRLWLQVASVGTKAAAEAEYNRILSKNKSLKEFRKKIVKVDLGEKKGIRYRIQVGPFEDKKKANNVISTLKKNGFAAYISK